MSQRGRGVRAPGSAGRHAAGGARPPVAHRNRALDGLRGLAVVAVVLRHLDVRGFGGGGTGVFLFFVLSGFLITELLVAEFHENRRIALGAFWARRAYRLLPALFATIAVAMLLAAAVGGGFWHTGQQSLPALFYVANWWRVHEITGHGVLSLGPFGHTWSLSVEEQFYLFWPPILLVLLRLFRRRMGWVILVTGALALASLGERFVLWDPHQAYRSAALVYNRTDTEAVLLLTGAVAGLLLHLRPAAATRTASVRACTWLAVAGVAVLLVVAGFQPLAPGARHVELWWTFGILAFAVAGAVLCWSTVRAPSSVPARALGWAPLAGVGRISYGIYLYHYPLVVFLLPHVHGAAGDLLVVAATAAVSTASWFALEQPILRAHRHRVRELSRLSSAEM